jgi:hypothetical protein
MSIGTKFNLGEFAHAVRAFVPLAPTLASLETVSALLALHPLDTNLPYSNSLLDFQSNLDFKLFVNSFRSIFWCMSHLLASGPSSMVFKHLQDSFNLKDSTSGFIQLHYLCSHVVANHILGSVVQVLGVNRFLVLAKPFNIIRSIIMGEVFYRLVNKALCL